MVSFFFLMPEQEGGRGVESIFIVHTPLPLPFTLSPHAHIHARLSLFVSADYFRRDGFGGVWGDGDGMIISGSLENSCKREKERESMHVISISRREKG